MKQLSIEEKAKRYDEAVERAKKEKEKSRNLGLLEFIEDLFPELAESEDERIRKGLINTFSVYYKDKPDGEWDGKPVKDIIAWLEKQGNKDEEILVLKDQIESLHAAIKALKEAHKIELEKQGENSVCKVKIGETYKCIAPPRYTCFRMGDICHVKDNFVAELINICSGCFVLLEKQGEQKSVIDMITPEESLGIDSDTYNKIVDECIYGEQKPADKVEPKFHEGEWVVYEYEGETATLQITRIVGETYVFSDDSTLGVVDEDTLRLWTIQDVKDGDVLVASDDSIFIFKDAIDGACRHYVALTTDNVVKFNEGLEHYWEDLSVVHPATKEQCDLLFQNIKEAGYEWDAEKKELKKIEQKPAENKGMNLVEEKMTPFQKKVSCIIDTTIEEEQGLKQVCDKLLRLASNEIKQQPAWSEEDEYYYGIVQYILSNECVGKTDKEEAINWFKSLKERVQPKQEWGTIDEKVASESIDMYESEVKELKDVKTKQEWSEEDELHIKELESLVKRVLAIGEHENDKDTIHEMSDLSFFLKTLKPQPKQKWSEDDEQMLTEIVKDLQVYKSREISRDAKDAYQNEIDWLKSLKPQNRWKPSDSEIEKASQEWNSKASFSPFYMTKGNDVKRDVTTHGDSFKAGVKWVVKSLNIQSQWKPSDEQMEALNDVISSKDIKYDVLSELWEDLQKLREK